MFEIKEGPNRELILAGRFDASQAEKAKTVFLALSEGKTVDFAGLDYISSAGLGVLLAAQKRLSERGQSLRLRFHCREPTSWVRIRKPPRWSAERGPGRPGTGGSRVAGATERTSAACRRSIHPSSGGRNCCCRDGRWRPSPPWLAGGRESEGTCQETDKPGRSNAPRERTMLRCLTS